MKYGKLRIAWSVAWGVVAVLLVVLWVRSYWWSDQYHLHGSRLVGGATNRGWLALHWLDVSKRNSVQTGYHGYSVELLRWKEVEKSIRQLYRYRIVSTPEGFVLILPIWFAAAIIAIFAAAPWLPWRYSLRTFLIATTLIVVGLGIVVWLSK
jgi:hypothetical protein